MNDKVLNKANKLIRKLPKLIKNFPYRDSPGFYFYKKVLSKIRKNKEKAKLRRILKTEKFIEFLYATLGLWGMDSRGAKMKGFDEFYKEISKNRGKFVELSSYELHKLSKNNIHLIKNKLAQLYDNLNLMESNGRLVSNSKLMHFILPDLVMSMDGKNTLNFFYGNTGESRSKFLEIFEASWYITRRLKLKRFLNKKLNSSIPKVIDNAILEYFKSKRVLK